MEAVVTSFFLSFTSFSWANKLDALTRVSTSDPEGYLGHPVNAYKLMKRLNTEWTELESLVLQNPSDGREEKGMQLGRDESEVNRICVINFASASQ